MPLHSGEVRHERVQSSGAQQVHGGQGQVGGAHQEGGGRGYDDY